jgi:hypothetical protein
MLGILISMFLPIYLVGLIFMAILQMIGGKFIAKLENAGFGSSLMICFLSSILTALILTVLGKMSLLTSTGSYVFASIIISIWSLLYVTKSRWKSPSYGNAFKASSVNIFGTVIFWVVVFVKIGKLLSNAPGL